MKHRDKIAALLVALREAEAQPFGREAAKRVHSYYAGTNDEEQLIYEISELIEEMDALRVDTMAGTYYNEEEGEDFPSLHPHTAPMNYQILDSRAIDETDKAAIDAAIAESETQEEAETLAYAWLDDNGYKGSQDACLIIGLPIL